MTVSPQMQQFLDFFDDMVERKLLELPPGWRLAVGPADSSIVIEEGKFPTHRATWEMYPIDPNDPNPMLINGFSTFGPLTDTQRKRAEKKFNKAGVA